MNRPIKTNRRVTQKRGREEQLDRILIANKKRPTEVDRDIESGATVNSFSVASARLQPGQLLIKQAISQLVPGPEIASNFGAPNETWAFPRPLGPKGTKYR